MPRATRSAILCTERDEGWGLRWAWGTGRRAARRRRIAPLRVLTAVALALVSLAVVPHPPAAAPATARPAGRGDRRLHGHRDAREPVPALARRGRRPLPRRRFLEEPDPRPRAAHRPHGRRHPRLPPGRQGHAPVRRALLRRAGLDPLPQLEARERLAGRHRHQGGGQRADRHDGRPARERRAAQDHAVAARRARALRHPRHLDLPRAQGHVRIAGRLQGDVELRPGPLRGPRRHATSCGS